MLKPPAWFSQGQKREFEAICDQLRRKRRLRSADPGTVRILALARHLACETSEFLRHHGPSCEVFAHGRAYRCPCCRGKGIRRGQRVPCQGCNGSGVIVPKRLNLAPRPEVGLLLHAFKTEAALAALLGLNAARSTKVKAKR